MANVRFSGVYIALCVALSACTINQYGTPTAPAAAMAPKPPATTAAGTPTATSPPSAPPSAAASLAAAAAAAGATAPGELKKYDAVVTKDAKTSRGMILYHKVKDRHYFELPEKLLGRDLFWSVEVAQSSGDVAFNGLPLGAKVLRFERVDNRILLRAVSFNKRGSEDLKAATDAVDLAPIVMSFNIETEGNERSVDLREDEKKKPDAKDAKDPADAKKDDAPPVAKPTTAEGNAGITAPAKKTEEKDAPKVNATANATATATTTKPPAEPAKKLPPTKEKWPVIDVARLLLTASTDLIDARMAGPQGLGMQDPSRALVNQVKVFPENVEVRSTLTFSSTPFPTFVPGAPPVMPSMAVNPSRTAILHYSLAMLPEKPMQGRFADQRVGFFTERFQEYGGARSGVRFREFITRFRLEKKNPAEEISDVVKPITFYIAPEVPAKWRKYLKAGVEDWQGAFEKAGYRQAIIASDPPDKKTDPNWDAEDARYSVIRWVAQPVANAMGPSVHDPRSGEVVSAHIVFWHDILRVMEQLYFAQSGSADKRVTTLPLSDEVLGELLRYVTSHEVGHTLGLRHNHRASTAYAVKDLRNPAFADKEGTVASIMAYGRFNSVAQPQDGVTRFVPQIGPYDIHAVVWGYKSLAKKSSDEEVPELDLLAARAINDTRLAFGGEDMAAFFDPDVQTENIGKERIKATKLSLASLERAAARLVPATTKLGEDETVLRQTYNMLVNQRLNYVASVIKMIGGVRETRFLGGRGGDSFVRATKDEQRAAIRYLLDEGLTTPKWLVQPALLNRIRIFNVSQSVVRGQTLLLQEMMSPIRFRLLEDAQMMAPGSGLSANQYLNTLRGGVFRELNAAAPVVDVYRRELQKMYLDQLIGFSGEVQRITNFNSFMAFVLSDVSVDLRPAALQALRDLQRDARAAVGKTRDEPTRLHLTHIDREIEQILKIRGS